MSSKQSQPSASAAPKKKKREDFHLGTILGEGSYSTVSIYYLFPLLKNNIEIK